jgi:hypothetical protein
MSLYLRLTALYLLCLKSLKRGVTEPFPGIPSLLMGRFLRRSASCLPVSNERTFLRSLQKNGLLTFSALLSNLPIGSDIKTD